MLKLPLLGCVPVVANGFPGASKVAQVHYTLGSASFPGWCWVLLALAYAPVLVLPGGACCGRYFLRRMMFDWWRGAYY